MKDRAACHLSHMPNGIPNKKSQLRISRSIEEVSRLFFHKKRDNNNNDGTPFASSFYILG